MPKVNRAWVLLALALVLAPGLTRALDTRARLIARLPHDRSAFTEGLVFDDGVLYESTGRYGHSQLRRVDVESGRVVHSVALAPRYFGEGLALVGNRLYQLTWKAGRGFIYDRDSLKRIATFDYRGQGWGLTFDGQNLIMSDGSATLCVRRPSDFSVVRRIRVRDDNGAVDMLNELEYIDGEIWANRWKRDRIVRIAPADGRVLGYIDASSLRDALPAQPHAGVLNGIAWDAPHRRLYLTGKNWPRLFEFALPKNRRGKND